MHSQALTSCCLSCFFRRLPTCLQSSWFRSLSRSKSRCVCCCWSCKSWSRSVSCLFCALIRLFIQVKSVGWTDIAGGGSRFGVFAFDIVNKVVVSLHEKVVCELNRLTIDCVQRTFRHFWNLIEIL